MESSINQSVLNKFDPELHRKNVHDAFNEFVESFHYEYDAIAKDPPSALSATEKATWIEINKRKIFLGRFASRNFQRDFEDTVPMVNRSSLKFSELVRLLKNRYKPTRNYTLFNYEFHRICQHSDKIFDTFVHRLKHEAKSCKFACSSQTCNIPDIMVRDQIIVGTKNDDIRKNSLKNQWDLNTLIENGRKLEAASHTAQVIADDSPTDAGVSRVKPGKYSRKSKRNKPKVSAQMPKSQCFTCSSKLCHGGSKCPASQLSCFACGKPGHFQNSKACKRRKSGKARRLKTAETDQESSLNSEDDSTDSWSDSSSSDSSQGHSHQSLQHVKKKHSRNRKHHIRRVQHSHSGNIPLIRMVSKSRYHVNVVIKEQIVKAFADTGADINVMSESTARKLNLPSSLTKTKVRPYGSKPLKCIGKYNGTVMFNNAVSTASFFIIKGKVETLLSGKLCETLGIISFNKSYYSNKVRRVRASSDHKQQIIQQYPTIFQGVGTLQNHEVHFYVDPSISPKAQASRPIPFHLRDRFQKEIDTMEQQGIIEEHMGPAPWVSNPVLTPKDDGGIRVTIDLREVNKAIHATNIPIPRVEDVKAKLSNNKIFSKLDFKAAFHQLLLDGKSRALTVFHAGQRLMRYRKLTMGAKPASGELTKALIPVFGNMQGVHVIHDDVIIAGKNKADHDLALHQALKKIRDVGMTLNPEKCIFSQKEIPFWGMLVTRHGIKPDPTKVESLRTATRPQNKDEVMSFLCFVQSFGDFIPRLSRKTTHLRKLTKKHKEFRWNKECMKEFNNLTRSLEEDTALRYFNINLPTHLFVDAHQTGISAILAQGKTTEDCRPVAFASRSTRDEEQRYPQIDLEALAVDFALRRFRHYLVGGPEAKVHTDHKPLVSIFSNARKGSIRTDRIKMRHQDISYKVVYKPGKHNPADYLSRHALPLSKAPEHWRKEAEEIDRTVWFLQYGPYTESLSLDDILEETRRDKTLRCLKKHLRRGYIPKNLDSLQPYRKFQDQLTIIDGIIYKKDRIILPQSLWKRAIDKAHQGGHPGMTNLKRRIRSHFWIPELNKLVEKKVKKCEPCQYFTNKKMHEIIQPVPFSNEPWQDVSVDLFGPMPDHRHIAVVQDIKTRFPAATIVKSTAAKHVIPTLEEIYAMYGHPDSHRTDNGPPFNSKEFKEFSANHGIRHRTSYPYHPQANPVETFMRPLGKAMKIAHFESKNKEKALNDLLTSYRSTPHPSTGQTPGNLMFRGGYKQDFPRHVLTEAECNQAAEQDKQNKLDRQHNMNKSKYRKQSDMKSGDIVIIRNFNTTKFQPTFGPDTYRIISTDSSGFTLGRIRDNKILRRHGDDIKLYHASDNGCHTNSTPTVSPDQWWDWSTQPATVIENEPDIQNNHEEFEDHGNNDQTQTIGIQNSLSLRRQIFETPTTSISRTTPPRSRLQVPTGVFTRSPSTPPPITPNRDCPTRRGLPRALTRLRTYNKPGFLEFDREVE